MAKPQPKLILTAIISSIALQSTFYVRILSNKIFAAKPVMSVHFVVGFLANSDG